MRILWSAQYHVGCTASAMPVALELRDRGHEVVVVAPAGAAARFTDLGLGFRPNIRFPDLALSRPGGTPVKDDPATATDEYMRWWRGLMRSQVDDTLELLDGEHYDLVLGGGCMMLCGHGFAAEKAGLPWVSYVDFLGDEHWTMEEDLVERWHRWRESLGVPPDPRPAEESGWYPFSPHLTLLLVMPELWWRAELPTYVHRVGATLWDGPVPSELPGWYAELGGRRPAVLVSTSSLWQDDADLVVTSAEGLADQDLDVVVTVSAEHELPALPSNVIVTRYFPHSLLIPRVSAVICAAGLGTVTRAVSARVPVVVVPGTGDGPCVARAVADAGVGVVLRPEQLSAATVRDAVLRVMSEPRFPEAARRVQPVATDVTARVSADLIEGLPR